MRIIEFSKKTSKKGNFHQVIDRINQMLAFERTGEHAEDAIIARFMRGLDNNYVMAHNLPQEGSEAPFPPILIGPFGIALLSMSTAQGFFQAKEDDWLEMKKTTHKFSPGRPNLIKQSQEYAQKLAELLDGRGKSHPNIVPLLVFANPGINIETSNPAIRIVLMDGVDNLISTLLTSEAVLSLNEINSFADMFGKMQNPEEPIPVSGEEDFFGRDLIEAEQKASPKTPKIKFPPHLALPAVEERFKFTPRQWLIIEVLLGLIILVLIAGILYVLFIY